MATFGLTSTGINLPRAADFIETVQSTYEELTGEAPDWDNDLVVRSLVVAVADKFDGLSEMVQSIYDSWDENNATGRQLDNIAAISPGIDRKFPTRSQVTITLGGTASTVIPSGALVELDGDRFVLDADADLGTAGSVDAVFVAEETGAIPAPAATWDIVTTIAGWDTAVSAAAGSVGRDLEDDIDLRLRRRLSMQIAGGNSLGAMLGVVLALPFITDAIAIENDSGATKIVSGVELPPNSVAVVVTPNPLTTPQATTLAQVIYALSPMGIETFGTETATATRVDGVEKTVAFSYPTAQNVSTQATYKVAPGYDAGAVEALVDAAIDAFFDELGPGDAARRLACITYVSASVVGLLGFDINFDGLTGEDVEPPATKVAVRTTVGSTLTQVA